MFQWLIKCVDSQVSVGLPDSYNWQERCSNDPYCSKLKSVEKDATVNYVFSNNARAKQEFTVQGSPNEFNFGVVVHKYSTVNTQLPLLQ